MIGLWKFDTDDGADATGRLPKGALLNGKLVTAGKFGGALESFAGSPEADRSHGFFVSNNPQLSPSGAFSIESDAAEFVTETWQHLGVTYDGHGKVRFFLNGESFGEVNAPGRGAISAGAYGLSIGDRLGSSYPGFPGFVDEVRLTNGVRVWSGADHGQLAEKGICAS